MHPSKIGASHEGSNLRRLALAGVAALSLSLSIPAQADVIVSIGNVTALAGSNGQAVDVTLQNTGLSPVTVDGFAFEFTTADTDVTFTEADISTADPYIFLNNSSFGPVISTTSPDAQTVNASDLWAGPGDGAVVGAGATVGLGEVLFDIAAGAAAEIALLDLDANGTSLSDINGDTLSITLAEGSIDVKSGLVITPEPSTFAAMTLLSIATCFARKRGMRA